MMNDFKREREMDEPAGWKTDIILQRNIDGEVYEAEIPDDDPYSDDDEEVTDDAENN